MKFTCTQENLSKGLTLVSRAASRNVTLPILNNVLLVAEQNSIQLQTTNLELAVSVTIRGKIESPGRYTVQSRLLAEFMSFLEHENITLELTDAGLVVTSGHSHTTIKGLPADEFPVLPKVSDGQQFSLPANELQRMLEGVVFAAANDESRPEISGIYLQAQESRITVAATDSYRLAERHGKALSAPTQPVAVILPSRTAQELLRNLPGDATEVKISAGETQISFQLETTEIVSRLIEGRYPDYQNIVPKQFSTKITASRDALTSNIRAASLFCKPGIHDLTVRVDEGKKSLFLQAANTQVGEHESSMPAEYEGQPQEVVFNYRYLLDGLQSLHGEEITIELTDAQSPGVLRASGQADDLYLLMPIRQ